VSGVVLDPERRTVRVNGQPVEFTRLQFDVLAALIAANGRVLTPTFFLEEVWEREVESDSNTIKAHVVNIRRKLGPERHRLKTVRGVGYRWVSEKEEV